MQNSLNPYCRLQSFKIPIFIVLGGNYCNKKCYYFYNHNYDEILKYIRVETSILFEWEVSKLFQRRSELFGILILTWS